MLAVSDTFFQSESLTYAAAAIALLVAALLLLLIFRRAFRRRLRVPETGNAGRLGIAKTFALDQSRQLVVVRRDHVEHLVMIGGPNDLVVESDIVGAAGRDPVEIDENRLGEEEAEEKRFTPMRP
jgi:flagellar protein FliO/FliZ